MRRLLALALVALSAAGCASSADFASPPRIPVGDPPAGQVVFQVTSGGGLEPYAIAIGRRPAVTIYGDGRGFTLLESRTFAGAPTGIGPGRVSRSALRRLMDDAQRSGLFDDADFGYPHVTDLGSTTVTFRPASEPARRAGAYALSYRDGDEQLTAGQRRNREALRTLVARLTKSVRFGDVNEYLPTQVDVTAPDASAQPSAPARRWPGPALDALLTHRRSGGRCGIIAGDAARRVYLAARDNSTVYWTVAGRSRPLVVRALLPGERGCSDA